MEHISLFKAQSGFLSDKISCYEKQLYWHHKNENLKKTKCDKYVFHLDVCLDIHIPNICLCVVLF